MQDIANNSEDVFYLFIEILFNQHWVQQSNLYIIKIAESIFTEENKKIKMGSEAEKKQKDKWDSIFAELNDKINEYWMS